jgi:hypothetical protein
MSSELPQKTNDHFEFEYIQLRAEFSNSSFSWYGTTDAVNCSLYVVLICIASRQPHIQSCLVTDGPRKSVFLNSFQSEAKDNGERRLEHLYGHKQEVEQDESLA